MDVKTLVTELLQPYLNEDQFFIVDIQVSPSRNRHKITVLLDSDTGIRIDECAQISRRLGNQLEEADIFEGQAFTLEVSSPGLDQPLLLPRQYHKNVGREVVVLLNDGQTRRGRLEEVAKNGILFRETPARRLKKNESPPEPVLIPFADIRRTTVQVSFN